MMTKAFPTLACLVLAVAVSPAQRSYDRSDFERINQTYKNMTVLRTEVDYVYYQNHYTTTAAETLKAVLSIKGDAVHYRLGEVETLHTPGMTILADHEERQLLLNNNPPSVNRLLMGAELDTLLSVCDRISYSTSGPDSKKYELNVDLPELERIDFYFNTRTFLMQRVVLFYSDPVSAEDGGTGEKPRLELIYRRQDTDPVFAKDLFAIERFVRKSGSGYERVQAFQPYEFIDYLSK